MFGFNDTKLAKLHYGTPEYTIIKSGDHVLCAMSGDKILLADLKYWNVERQEAYKDAELMFKREIEFKNQH